MRTGWPPTGEPGTQRRLQRHPEADGGLRGPAWGATWGGVCEASFLDHRQFGLNRRGGVGDGGAGGGWGGG